MSHQKTIQKNNKFQQTKMIKISICQMSYNFNK